MAVSGAGTSVLVHFDPRRLSCDEILGLLADVGLLVKDLGEASEESLTDLGHSETANSLIRALDDLDQRIARLTGHQVDLKLLVPLGMATLGVLQVAREGLGITQVPGYVLLWYAFDAFYKLHRSAPVQAPEDRDQPADVSVDCELTPR